MAADEKRLEAAARVLDTGSFADAVSRLTTEIRAPLPVSYNWQELLQLVPATMITICSCYVASASGSATGCAVEFPAVVDPGDTSMRKYRSFAANLSQCANLGVVALRQTEESMGIISKLSGELVGDQFTQMCDSLTSPENHDAAPQFKEVKAKVDKCLEQALLSDKDLSRWLNRTAELHVAYLQSECEEDTGPLKDVLSGMGLSQTTFEDQTQPAHTKSAVTKLEKQIEFSFEDFIAASDRLPDNCIVIWRPIVGSLTETISTTISQMIKSRSGLDADSAPGAGSYRDLIQHEHSKNHATSCRHCEKEAAKAKAAKNGPPPATMGLHSADPAYTEAKNVVVYFELMSLFFNKDDNDGVKWDVVTGTGDASITALAHHMLSGALERFKPVATSKSPAKQLLAVLKSEIAKGLLSEAKKPIQELPAADSGKVKAWRETHATNYNAVRDLAATGRMLPDAAPCGVLLVGNIGKDSATALARTSAASAAARVLMETATSRAVAAERQLDAAREQTEHTAKKRAEERASVKDTLEAVTKANQLEDLSWREARAHLVSCVEVIGRFKTRMMAVCRFLAVIRDCVGAVSDAIAAQHLESQPSDGDEPVSAKGSLVDYGDSLVVQAAVVIRAYMGTLSDVANTWIRLSAEHIGPGIALCDELASLRRTYSGQDRPKLAQRVARVQEWWDAAQSAISAACDEQNEAARKAQERRVEEIQSEVKLLRPLEVAPRRIEAWIEDIADFGD